MRVSREEAERTRRRVLKTAGKVLRRRGIAGTGVAEVMAEAGLTHGGFYRHFASKDDLVRESCQAVLTETVEGWRTARDAAPDAPLVALVQRYLTPVHRDHPEAGCIYAALAAEAGRTEALGPPFAQALDELLEILESAAEDEAADGEADGAAARRAAMGRLSAMLGALVLARTARGTPLSDAVLTEVRAWLLEGRA